MVPLGANTYLVPKSLPVKTRKKLLNRVLRQKIPVAQACREFGVSRYTFYKWLKRYKADQGLKDKQRRVKRFWRQADRKIVEEVRRIALEYPNWSKYRIQKALPKDSQGQPILGVHGVYNILKRLSLSTPEKRKLQSQLVQAQRPRVLAPEERLAMIERVIRGGATIAQVCRELQVSRFTFYKWLKRYQKASSSQRLLALTDKERRVERWWHQATPEQEELVLKVVVENPTLSKYKIAERLTKIAGRPVLGPHGVYNVLRRRNLTLPEARLAYAQSTTPIIKPVAWLDHVRLVWEEFIPSLAPAPPPAFSRQVRGFAKITLFSSFLTTVFFLAFLFSFQMLSGQPPSTKIGLFFAAISLTAGSFFFAYSMKYYLTLAIVLSFSRQPLEEGGSLVVGLNGRINNNQRNESGWLARIFGLVNGPPSLEAKEGKRNGLTRAGGLQPSLDHIKLKRYPFVSIHLPFYNEIKVAERILKACTAMDYPNFEIVVIDDSTDETTKIVEKFVKKHNKANPHGPKIKVLHRPNREGFKGGALGYALQHIDPKAEFVVVFDADFIPYPDTLELFIKYFKVNNQGREDYTKSDIAVVGGYQWHVLNKSENWITRGVRAEYAGSYVIERPGQEILGAMRLIHGSVYAIRADLLKKFGWGTSITEDFELTLKLYEKGYKVVYTPYIQAPAECVSTLKRLIRQRMRWAEGHSNNIKTMFLKLIASPKLSLLEKLEVLYLSPYYLQAAFFMVGTFSWLIAETVFRARLPFWTSLWGWSLVLTNFFSLPLMNAVGLFLEESEQKDYAGILSFIFLSYILVPFQAYASIKGFLGKEEGPWFRTPKTGKITDIFTRGRFYRWVTGIIPGRTRPPLAPITADISADQRRFRANPYVALATANNQFNNFRIKPQKLRWLADSFLVLLLLATTLLFSLAPAISTNRSLFSTAEAQTQKITTPVDIRMPQGDSQIITTQAGNFPLEEQKIIDFIFHQEPRVRVKLQEKELEFQTKNLGGKRANPEKSTIEGKRVTYEEIFPNVDLVYEVQDNGVSEKFILKKFFPIEEIEQNLIPKELEARAEDEQISFFNQAGEKVFSFGQPLIYEQANPEVKSFGIKFVLEKDTFGFKLKKQITEEGKTFLADSTRVYPVVIDPTVITTSGIGSATSYSTQRKIVKTSEDTLHAFIQTYNQTMDCAGLSKYGLLWVTSDDDGSTWSCQGQLTSNRSVFASVTVDSSDNIYVVYSGTSSGGLSAFYRKFTKGAGSSWTMEAQQTAINSNLEGKNYTFATAELEGTTRLWLATRFFFGDKNDIKSIAGNGSYWLIGGQSGYGSSCQGVLVKFDGTDYIDLTQDLLATGFNTICYDIDLAWNGSYWLITSGQGASYAPVAKYDGTDFTNQDSIWGSFDDIYALAWNGTKWLIGGQNARLKECDTNLTCTDKSSSLVNFGSSSILAIAWNSTDEYWLIGGSGPKLNKYDETDFTDLSSSLVNFGTNAINSIAYNSTGNYFLIGGAGGKLNKYDGTDFTDLSGPFTGQPDLQGSESNDGGFGTSAVNSIDWNGSYWLIGGVSAKLAKYDGTDFTDLSSSLVGFSSSQIYSLSWDGTFSYWLIGGDNCRLNKYDGTDFTDLSSNLDSSFGDDKYRVKVYYSDGLGTAPTWTESAELDTADTSSSHIPTIVRFGTNIGVIYSENSSPELRWRKRADTDGLTTWDTEATVADLPNSPAYYFSATVDNSNQIHIGTPGGSSSSPQYLFYNGSSWSTPFTLGTRHGENLVSITTDGTDVYVLWRSGANMNAFSGYYNAGILSFRKGVSPFTVSDFGSETRLNSSDRIYDQVWVYTGSYIDETTDAGNDTIADITMPSAVDDIIYFGMTEKFRAVATRNSTSGSGCVVAWEYYNGTWTSLTLVNSYQPNFTSTTARIYFNPPSDWTEVQVNTDASPGYYYVRARVTTACGTAPVGTKAISASDGYGTSTIAKLTSGFMPVIWAETVFSSPYNVMFATVPENLWILLLGLPFLPLIFKRRRNA